ncbi:alpha/beta fold hydrolase [Kordiimonas sp. SCSIO 12610]|nr:alpha/beta fold hydrolase [Kordiimonas sp. SCSIO 12610]
MDLFYRVRGEGEPIILLHGLFGSLDNLGALVRGLEAEYKVIVVDMRNHGRSPHVDEMSYNLMAEDVLRVLDRENVGSAYVFGHSMGGKAAMQLALMAPERVSKLIVGDIAPVKYGPNHGRILEGMTAVAAEAPDSRKAAQEILSAYEHEPAVLSFLLTNWRKQENGDWGWRINLEAIKSQYPNIAAGMKEGSFTGPTLFIRGGNSDYITADYRDQILSLFPKAEVRTIEGTGHWFHAEKTDLTLRIIKRFIEV